MSEVYDRMQKDEAPASVETAPAAKPDRARDDTGKFVANTTVEMVAEPAQAEAAAVAPEAPETAKATTQPLEPPNSWPKEAKAAFAKLAPEEQQLIANHEREREQGINAKLQESHSARQFSEAVMQIANPYLPMIQAEGGNVLSAVQSLLNTAYRMRQDPRGTIAELAHQFNVDLLDPDLAAGARPTVDPVQSELQSRLQALESHRIQEQRYAEQQVLTQAQTEIEQFGKSREAPFFAEVKAEMAAILDKGLAQNLKEAYEWAVAKRPDLSSKIMAERQAAEAKAKANEALKASSVNVAGKGAPAGAVDAKQRTMRDTMSEIYDRVNAA